jgi:hypothetical protein
MNIASAAAAQKSNRASAEDFIKNGRQPGRATFREAPDQAADSANRRECGQNGNSRLSFLPGSPDNVACETRLSSNVTLAGLEPIEH